MKYKITVLNILILIYLLCTFAYTIYNWKVLSFGEGWGVVGMMGLFSIGLGILILDFIFQKFIKDRKTLIVVQLSVMVLIVLFLIKHLG